MPRLNSRGQALMGVGDGPASVDGRLIITPGGGPASWLDDDTIVVNSNGNVLAVDVATGHSAILKAGGANTIAAGGLRWLGWLSGRGMFGSLGDMPAADVRGAGLDGTLAYCPDRQIGYGFVLVAPNGDEFEVEGAVVLDEYALQVLGPREAVWFGAGQLWAVGVPAPRPALASGKMRRVVAGDGTVWLVYWSEDRPGLIAQPDGSDKGYVLETRPIAFNHDAVAVGGEIVIAWSVTQGEMPGDLVRFTLDRNAPMVPLDTDDGNGDIDPPPQPTPEPYYRAKEYRMAASEIGAIKGPGNKFGRVVAADAGTGPMGWFPIRWDRDTPDADCWFELTKPDSRHCLRPTNGIAGHFGADATEHSTDLTKEFYVKPDSAGGRGILEMPILIYDPASSLIVGYLTWPDKVLAGPAFAWVKK